MKKLYVNQDPIVLIVYNCFSQDHQNSRDINRLAQLIAGKVSLLSEITKKPCKIRVALTHLDQIPGYLEFARFLKQQKLDFNIALNSQFDPNTLENELKGFLDEHMTLMLTTNTHLDFANIIRFSKEMPALFAQVEEFLRAVVARVSFSGLVELDMLSLTSSHSNNTAFNPFQWKRLPSMNLFFRHPMLKVQLAATCLFLFFSSFILYSYVSHRNELQLAQFSNEQLDLLQLQAFEDEILPKYVRYVDRGQKDYFYYLKPQFFSEKLAHTENQLATRIRKQFIDREMRKAILEHEGEIKCLYFVGLMHATRDNTLGKYFLKNADTISEALHIEPAMLSAYVNSCSKPLVEENANPLSNVNAYLPLASITPWHTHLIRIQELLDYPILAEQQFHAVVKDTDKLLVAIKRIRENSNAHPIAHLLEDQLGEKNCPENIRVVRWIGENIEALETFLLFIQQTSSMPVEIDGLNVAEFYTKVKERCSLKEKENQTYNFSLNGKLFSFQTRPWIDLVVSHNIEQAIHDYITVHNNSAGNIFFNNTTDILESPVLGLSGPVPLFKTKISIPSKYTRVEYEKKVKTTAEKLKHLIDSLDINQEERNRFVSFLNHEVLNYQKNFQDHYAKFFDLFDIPKNTTLEQIKLIIQDRAHLSSGFHDFLHDIHFHTTPLSDPVLSIRSHDTVNEFAFLNQLFAQENGGVPIAEYNTIIQQIMRDLDQETPKQSLNRLLDPYLTPAAVISAHILQEDEDSYLIKINNCLDEIGIPERYRSLFVKPVLHLYQLGLSDLKKGISRVWSMHFSPKIAYIFNKFPFDPQGPITISVQDLNELLNPQSEFYNTITSVMSTCCKKQDGIWHSIDPQNLSLEENITPSLTALQNIADLLWDKEGNPKAITLNIKTVPFTPNTNENPVVVRSYLIIGDEEIKNLNQTPEWQTVKLNWWKDEVCLVGVELLNKDGRSKSWKKTEELHTPWSFFELLREASQDEGNTWSWSIANKEGREPYKVSFNFERIR